jgi:hypothetical protein
MYAREEEGSDPATNIPPLRMRNPPNTSRITSITGAMASAVSKFFEIELKNCARDADRRV